MRAMRAEGFRGYKDVKLVDIPKPALSDGRVLVRITAAGVMPLDHTILTGGHPRAKAPLMLGNEGAGAIEDAGDSGLAVGSRVMFTGNDLDIATRRKLKRFLGESSGSTISAGGTLRRHYAVKLADNCD